VNWHWFENVRLLRFGQGALSKFALTFLVLVAAICAISVFGVHDLRFSYCALGVLFLAFLLYLAANFLTMKLFPLHSLLEGAQFGDVFERSQGIKGMPNVADMPSMEGPKEKRALTARTEDDE
jgi:hypothetical protein